MSTPEIYSDGACQWRCAYCGRIYISKIDADNCCKGNPRPKQVQINGEYYYYGIEFK